MGHNMFIGCHFWTHESSMSSADHTSAIHSLKKYDIRWLQGSLFKRAWSQKYAEFSQNSIHGQITMHYPISTDETPYHIFEKGINNDE